MYKLVWSERKHGIIPDTEGEKPRRILTISLPGFSFFIQNFYLGGKKWKEKRI